MSGDGLISSGDHEPRKAKLSGSVRALQDGSFLKTLFFCMMVVTAMVIGVDLREMMDATRAEVPGYTRTEPYPMEPTRPGDQVRPYLPKTMPVGPGRGKPVLPGYFGPLDGNALSQDLAFYRGDNGRVTAIGRINSGAAAAFEKFLQANREGLKTLVLHTPGGSVTDALRISNLVRRAGLSTEVPDNAYCASSCPLVLAGGVSRSAGENAWVGVHQVYAPQAATSSHQRGMSDAQSISAICQKLLVEMGVDPELWILAMQTPAADLYVLTPEEMAKYKLTFDGTEDEETDTSENKEAASPKKEARAFSKIIKVEQ